MINEWICHQWIRLHLKGEVNLHISSFTERHTNKGNVGISVFRLLNLLFQTILDMHTTLTWTQEGRRRERKHIVLSCNSFEGQWTEYLCPPSLSFSFPRILFVSPWLNLNKKKEDTEAQQYEAGPGKEEEEKTSEWIEGQADADVQGRSKRWNRWKEEENKHIRSEEENE